MARRPVYRGQFNIGKLFHSLLILAAAFVFILYTAPSDPDCFDDDAPYASSTAWFSVNADGAGSRKAPTPKVHRLVIDRQSHNLSVTEEVLPEEATVKQQRYLGPDKIRDPPTAPGEL